MSLSLQTLKQLIREYALAVARNYHTIDNDPYSWKEIPGIDVEEYMIPEQGHFVQVTVDADDSLSTPRRVFKDSGDAMMFARKEVEKIKVELMNRGLLD